MLTVNPGGLVRPAQRTTPALSEKPQNSLAGDPTTSPASVKSLPRKAKTRRGRRAKRAADTAPAVTFAPSEAGFAQFLKEHSSPKHQRVTAGGRIVPMPFIEDSDPVEGPSGRPAATHGLRNDPRDMVDRLNEQIGQDEQPWRGPGRLASFPGPTTTDAPRAGLLPGFDPARDGHPNADPFVRSLRGSDPIADTAMNRMHPLSSAQQGRTGGDELRFRSMNLQSVMGVRPDPQTTPANQQHGMRERHMKQTSPGQQNVMSMHPPVQMVPLAQQYAMGPVLGFYPTAQMAPIVPQYAMGVGHMAQSYAPAPNMMMMHPSGQVMPVIHQPGMGFFPAAHMAPIAQQTSMGSGAMPPTAPAQTARIDQQNSTDARAMPPASDPIQGGAGVHGVAETRPAARETGMRLNPTAPEFVHRATVQDTNPARNPASAQGAQASAIVEESHPIRDAPSAQTGVQARDSVEESQQVRDASPAQTRAEARGSAMETEPVRNTVLAQPGVQARDFAEESQPVRDAPLAQTRVEASDIVDESQPIRDAAPAQASVPPSWPPVTPPPRTVEVQTPETSDSTVLSPEGRPFNRRDLEHAGAVVNEMISMTVNNLTVPIDEYERRLLFLVNLIISTRENEGFLSDLLKVLRLHEDCVGEKIGEVNRESTLFDLNSRRQTQLQSRPDFVARRVYWSLVRGMTATAIEHLERIRHKNDQRQEAEERADFEAVENALARFNLLLDPEMTTADSQFELAPNSSNDLEPTNRSEQNLNRGHSIMDTIQEVDEASEPYERGNDKANEASQPSPLGQEPQPVNADTPSQAMGENGARDTRQADEAIE